MMVIHGLLLIIFIVQFGVVCSYIPAKQSSTKVPCEDHTLTDLVETITLPIQSRPAFDAVGAAFSVLISTIDNFKSIPRKIKILTSSEVESILLELTMPSSTLLDVDNRLHQLASTSAQHEEEIYDLILRKLRSKFKEKDWRIGGKALHIIHNLIKKSPSVQDKHSFCSSYIGKVNKIVENVESHVPLHRRDFTIPANLDARGIQRRWLKSYTEYLHNFSELICREVGSYWSDLVVMKGPVPPLQLYTRFFTTAQSLLQNSIALTSASLFPCSFSETIASATIDLIASDVSYSMSKLQALMSYYSSEIKSLNSHHIGSFIEMQHVSSELRVALSRIASMTGGVEGTGSGGGGDTGAVGVGGTGTGSGSGSNSIIPNWLNDLTSMESPMTSSSIASAKAF